MLRVLLVDDEPFIMQGLKVLIDWEVQGYEVVGTAGNGQEALQFLRTQKVDLIIADIKMPVMNGIELLQVLREEKISDAYFVILSGHGDFQYARQALRYKCMDYMLKPVEREELLGILRKVAENHEQTVYKQQQEKQSEEAYLARNMIALLSGKYDHLNLNYIKEHMRLSAGLRYIYMEMDVLKGAESLTEEEKRKFQRELYHRCKDYLGEADSNHCIFDVSRQEESYDIGVIYCQYMAKQQEKSEEEFIDELCCFLKDAVDIPVEMFVGSRVEDISKISESYQTASVMRSLKMFRTMEGIAYYEQEQEKDQSGAVLCKRSLDDLVRAIEQNDTAGIEANIETLYEEMSQLGLDSDLISLNINYLLFQLIHLATEQDDGVNQEEIMKFISGNTFDWKCLRGSREHLSEFAYAYAEYLIQLRKSVSHGILGQIEKEVKQRYHENLTLKELSKKYYINSAYLGQLFQKQYGQPFKEYLNQYRIEQAVNLLLRTDKKVYEIAGTVGYRDLDYFINRFILAKGCTPAKFRKQSLLDQR